MLRVLTWRGRCVSLTPTGKVVTTVGVKSLSMPSCGRMRAQDERKANDCKTWMTGPRIVEVSRPMIRDAVVLGCLPFSVDCPRLVDTTGVRVSMRRACRAVDAAM